MEMMEQAFAFPPDPPEPPAQDDDPENRKKRVKVRVSLYYDGTQNNRANTNVRKNVEQGQAKDQSDAAYMKALDSYAEHGSVGSSYDNDESNVSRLEGQSMKTAAGYDHYFHIYTEGIGTVDRGDDALFGLAMGAFSTGIIAKVDKGIQNALATFTTYVPKPAIIELLSLDVCGFSRGAAAARFAVYRALNGDDDAPPSLKSSLQAMGYEVNKVEVLAVCLFDTVSSYGLRYENNVKKLKLDAISQARAVLQLAAAEEYRVNFSLTDIRSAGGKGRHVYLPGSHSDVGGCYEDGMVEDKNLYRGRAARDLATFLLKRGWYRGRELRCKALDDASSSGRGKVQVHRTQVRKEYSYIPLHIMADFAKEQGLAFRETLEKNFQLRTSKHRPDEPDPIDAALVERIRSYASSVSESKPSDWEAPSGSLNALRNGYLHISFSNGIGMGVRLASTGATVGARYVPYRQLYHG